MKRSAVYLSILALGCGSALAIAQNAQGRDVSPPATTASAPDSSSTAASASAPATSSTKHQAMKECIARERANNTQMSKLDARKACKNEMMLQKQNQGTVSPQQ